jgi:hypothetical protein
MGQEEKWNRRYSSKRKWIRQLEQERKNMHHPSKTVTA